MSTSLKISANTSEVKKSLLDLTRDIKNIGKTKVSIFSEQDRKFIRSELKQELSLMKDKLKENKNQISEMIKEQKNLERGSAAELKVRKEIISAYKTQTKLPKEIKEVETQTGKMGGFLGKVMSIGKIGALGALAFGATKTLQSGAQFAAGAPGRVRLGGMGLPTQGFGSPEQLAKVGLTEQDFINRQVGVAGRLGKAGGSKESILQQAGFERSFGLEGGTMSNVSTSLRAGFGGKGADQAQMKLQASVLASGIEDALAPYLEAATDLLADINKNGVTNTDEMIRSFAVLTKESGHTPEQLSEMFKGINDSIKDSSGKANAFLQTAFARGGIGGGTIGSTKLALSSGGIFGLNPEELANRGYTPEQLKSMEGMGLTSGAGKRTGAILDQFRSSAGMKKGQSLGNATGNTMVGLAQMGNSIFGTQGMGGFDAIKMLEQFQNKQISKDDFDKQLKTMKEKDNPQLERLDKVNSTLAGQLTVQEAILENVMEGLGTKGGAKTRMLMTEAETQGVKGTANVMGAVDESGALDAARSGVKQTGDASVGGGLGKFLGNAVYGDGEENRVRYRSMLSARAKVMKKGNLPSTDQAQGKNDADTMVKAMKDGAKEGVIEGMKQQQQTPIQNNNKVNIKFQSPDGKVKEKTHK